MYYAWKKNVIQDTTRNYYIDLWILSQKLPYYQPETVTSFTCVTARGRACECVRLFSSIYNMLTGTSATASLS